MEKLLKEIKDIVYDCGKIILSAEIDKLEIDQKEGIGNIVTKYDKLIQERLKNKLLKLLPTANFIGKEDELKKNKLDDGYTFIVDPIDGTTNFSRDFHFSSISVALLKNKEPILGVCYNPYLNEIFTAIKNKGAYLNDILIHTSNKKLSDGTLLYGTASYYPNLRHKALEIQNKLADIASDYRNLGSAVLELCYIACGRCEVYFDLRLQPWDYAAASLIIKEAGGIVKNTDNKEIQYDCFSSIIATNNLDNYKLINSQIKFIDDNRLKHSITVARKMQEIACNYNLSEEDKNNLFVIGLNHDIGYEFTDKPTNHNKIGGEILKNTGFKFWKEVYYHGETDCDYKSTFLTILNMADMQIDNEGNDIGYTKRLENIKNRYGENSNVYQKCVKLVNDLIKEDRING
jgi:myo-inositol-1(or 4)-monophosphatase